MAQIMKFGKNVPAWVDEGLFQEAIKQVRNNMLFYPRLPDERIDFRLKSGFETACWSFSGNTHNIVLGTGIFANPSAKKVKSREDGLQYLQSFLNHELGHALNTLDDIRTRMTDKVFQLKVSSVKEAMEAMDRILRSKRIPFPLWNLFEDARIEELERKHNERKFEWTKYEDLNTAGRGISAKGLFFMLIQHEGNKSAVKTAIATLASTVQDLLERAWFYYDAARQCTRTVDLVLLLEQWVKEFPQDAQSSKPPGKNGEQEKGEGLQDLQLSFELSTDGAKLEQFLEGCKGEKDFDDDSDGANASVPPEMQDVTPNPEDRVFTQGGMLDQYAPDTEKLDLARLNEVLNRFKRFKTESRTKRYRDDPSKRYSARNDLRGLPPYRHDVIEPKPVIDCTVYLDCSGSMRGKPMHEAKILIAALSALSSSGRVKGHLILCTTSSGIASKFHRLKFPLSMDELNRVRSHNGGEGLEAAMRDPKNLSLTSRARHTFVVTDSNLTDEPLNKASLHSRGISTTAIYVGEYANEDKMRTYFDRYLIRDRIEDIVEELIKLSMR